MPSPKNRMKSTGDTHLPEVELDLEQDRSTREPTAADDEADDRFYADGYVPPGLSAGSADAAAAAAAAAAPSMADTLRQHATRSPLMVAGAVLAVGFVLAKLLRR